MLVRWILAAVLAVGLSGCLSVEIEGDEVVSKDGPARYVIGALASVARAGVYEGLSR